MLEQCWSVGACQRCRSVSEQCRSMSEQCRTWPQLLCCALALKNLVSVNFRLRRKRESCGAEVEWCGSKRGVMGSKCGAIGSKCGVKGIKMRSKGDQSAEQSGSKCGSKCGARWSKGYCFYLIPNWSLALRQAHLNTGLRRYRKKDYTKKIKSWKDRTIN